MQRRPFGTTGRDAPIIGQGTWYIDQADRDEAIAALRRGLDLGMTHIDTAEMYGDAESMLAEVIAGRRDEVFLVDKVLPAHASVRGTVVACERSLKRLQTDRIDVYLLHWRGPIPLADTVEAFEALHSAGKIAAWGVSNFDVDDLNELWDIQHSVHGPVCDQVLYHLEERAIEHEVLPWCEAHGLAVTAYAPFGHGEFPEPWTLGGDVLAQIATAHGATPRQVALAFLTHRPSVFAIPKSAKLKHVEENAGAGDLRLSEQEIAAIDRAFPVGARPLALPMI
jgi:diketogulonate reductase-like aldo/keto reductase